MRRATQKLAAIRDEFSESFSLIQAQYEQRIRDMRDRGEERTEREAVDSASAQEHQTIQDARDAGEEQVRVGFREALAALDS